MYRSFRFISLFVIIMSAEIGVHAQFLHHIRQNSGTEDQLKDFFSGLNISTDTLYAVILPPMGCPRCEGLINPFFAKLKKVDPKSNTALMAVYPLEKSTKAYLTKRHFLPEKQFIITDSVFSRYFSCSTPSLQVPVFVKLAVKEGKILRQLPALGINLTDSLILDFIKNNKEPDLYATVKGDNNQTPIELSLDYNESKQNFQLNLLPFIKKQPINLSNKFPVSLLLNLDFNSKYFVAQDDLSLSIALFGKNNNEWAWKEEIAPDKQAKNRYIASDVNDSTIMLLRKMNLLNSMYFAPQLTSGNTLFFTASLPKVFWENKATENIAYENKLVIAKMDLATQKLNFVDIKYRDTIAVRHTKAYFSRYRDFILMPISKGWPGVGTQMTPPDSNTTNDNPFSNKFYHFTPALAIFSKEGDYQKYLGRLPDFYKTLSSTNKCNILANFFCPGAKKIG